MYAMPSFPAKAPRADAGKSSRPSPADIHRYPTGVTFVVFP